jgi:tetratricopeptide (TPR) repeat protein
MSERVSSSVSTMRPQVARERIRVFCERFGLAHLLFAQHAALPLALTPDLLYPRLWANFRHTVQGEKLSLPWIAVADVLLSPLCEEGSHRLSEMDIMLRAELLTGLQASPVFGRRRPGELSSFLLDAIGQQLHSSNVNVRRLALAQRWTALASMQPGHLVQELRATLNDRIERIRVRSLIETLHLLAALLATDDTFLPLLLYVRGRRRLLRGKIDASGRRHSQALSPAPNELQLAPGNEAPSTSSAQQAARAELEGYESLRGRNVSNVTAERLFQRAYLLLAEGQLEHALTALDTIQAESLEQKREVAYLRAWGAMLQEHWDEAAQYILPQEISGETIADLLELGRTERRRRPYYLLVLGDVAANLWRYEEAIQHYTRCVKFLDERRMNNVGRRIRALLGLGLAHMATGYISNAVEYYEQALRLCHNDPCQHSLPDLYYGLSDACCRLGEFERALEYGNRALQVYTERDDTDLISRIRSLLGHIYCAKGDLQTSGAYYSEALKLALSRESIGAIFTTLTALAELRLQEGKPEEAWRSCEMALEYSKKVPRPYFVGKMDLVCGQVMEARAHQAGGRQRQEYLEQAVSYYEQAVKQFKQTNARPDLAEAYSRLARLLEEAGRQDQALGIWKSAYAARAGLDDLPML